MLRKAPKSRPSLDRCLEVLVEVDFARFKGTSSDVVLAEAARQVAGIEANAESEPDRKID